MTEPHFTRRDFVRLAALGAPAALLTACGWDGGTQLAPTLGAFSRLNDWMGERILMAPRRLARQYPLAARTGNAFPSYYISRSMPVLERPAEWALEVGGLVRKPTRFTLPMLGALPLVTYTVKHHCVEGWTAVATWSGVPLSTIATMVEPLPTARFLRFDSFDADYYNGWDLTTAMHPQTILAIGYNDQPLGPDHGAPLRLYSPLKLGYKLTKYLTRMTFTAERPGGYWEDQGYPWLGGV